MIKAGVKLHPSTIWAVAMPVIFEVFRSFGVTPVITSGVDGRHMPESLHYKGLAFDFRTRHVPQGDLAALTAHLSDALGGNFDVVLESDHVHVEFDP